MTEPLDLDAIRQRYAAWQRLADAGNDDLGEGTAAMLLAGNDVPALLAAVERLTAERDAAALERDRARDERNAVSRDRVGLRTKAARLTAERDQVACERDGVREELARMAGELDDARTTLEIRTRQLREERAEAERDAMRPVIERVRALVNGWREMDPAASLDVGEVVAEIEDALSAAQTPGVDTGTSEPRTAAHGDAGPADGAVAAKRDRYIACQLPMPGRRWCVRQIGHEGDCAWSGPLTDATGETL